LSLMLHLDIHAILVLTPSVHLCFFFFHATAPTEIYTLSLHDALPISGSISPAKSLRNASSLNCAKPPDLTRPALAGGVGNLAARDRKSTRLNSSHRTISYAVFCLKKKKKKKNKHESKI